MAALSWIDAVMLAVLALSVFVGLWRGLVFELMALIGWLAAWFGAQMLAPELSHRLPLAGAAGPTAPGTAPGQMLAAFALAFVGILVVWTLLARLARLLIQATPLSLPDRLLGGGFGLLRGGVLLLALATVLALTPAARWAPWQDSAGARWLGVVLHGLKPLLPEDMARHLPT